MCSSIAREGCREANLRGSCGMLGCLVPVVVIGCSVRAQPMQLVNPCLPCGANLVATAHEGKPISLSTVQ
jgi:hypothetical protein